ncbi:hypothetical protein [Chelativorans intermedius]|uniref:Lipoprotein n=1 Tax=Chelativorans intermedius TaxID=515947 RepID=A0ABV6DAD8_9HYPH|nr:hypothetical protein [Chelativorans intermedius]MCT8998667.1 hypothetical protein [Chelativorans intermedius]
MGRAVFKWRSATVFILLASASLAGCQQGGGPGLAGSAPAPAVEGDAQENAIRESELRAFCPPVTLREGTAYFRTYARGEEGNPDSVIYQASIADVTRACRYGPDATTMTVAVAGKIVPGPKGRTGTITMPIRVVAVRGEEVLYSQLFRHSVAVEDTAGATQFLFTDPNVVIPGGVDQAVRLLVGYDEGPGSGQ